MEEQQNLPPSTDNQPIQPTPVVAETAVKESFWQEFFLAVVRIWLGYIKRLYFIYVQAFISKKMVDQYMKVLANGYSQYRVTYVKPKILGLLIIIIDK